MATVDAYVCNYGGTISVIDPTSHLVIVDIALPGGSEPRNAHLTSDGLFLYINDTSANDDVLVVDTTTNTYLTSISLSATPVNLRPVAIGVTDTTCYVVGTTTASLPTTSGVVTIDVATNTVTGNIPLVNFYAAEAFVLVTPDQKWVYVAYNYNSTWNQLVCIDAGTNTIVDTYANVPGEFRNMCSDPLTTTIYAVDNDTNRMFVITPGSASPTSILTLGHPATGYIGTDSTGSWIYVPCTDQTVIVYDSATLTPTVVSVAAGSEPYYVVPSNPLTPYVYVTDDASINLFVFSGNTLVDTAVTPGATQIGAISPDGTTLFLTYPGGNSVPIFSTVTNTLIATTGVDLEPTWVVTANVSPVVVATEQIVMIA
jgi:DNA-binding beta-propeller fold protein YncE